jgi:tripartite-type tricarboxylate transporter receptor subunit TctC
MIRIARAILAGAWLLACAGGVPAAEPPAPLKVIHGFPPGGPPDAVARRIAERLGAQTGRTVTVENRAGASGTIAATAVAHAAPDGNTLLFGVAANLAVAPALMSPPPYDPLRAFTPIVEIARGPYVLLVRADAPAADFAGFVAWAKARPGRLNYASPGPGTVHHLATEMLKAQQGLHVVHIPYRGNLYPALLAGDVQVMFDSLPGPLAFLESGRLRALAVTGTKRLARLPAVPTLAELGVPGFEEIGSWWGFVAPAGMTPPMVAGLNAQLRQAMDDPELRATMDGWGITLTPGSPEAFGRWIAAENRRWKEQIRRVGVPLE